MEILSAFFLFPEGKMLLRSEGKRDEFYFPEEKMVKEITFVFK